MLSFTAPWVLTLLTLLPAALWIGRDRLLRVSRRRRQAAYALRLSVLGLMVAALAGPVWRTSEQRVSVMFLVDASASVGSAGQRAGMAWTKRAVQAQGPHDQAGMVLFGAAPRLAVPVAHYRNFPDPSNGPASATDIAAALKLGLGVLPADGPGRLVLLTDGRATTGRTDDAIAQAMARHVPIDTVAIAPGPLPDASVRAIAAPASVRAGDHVPLRITLHSTYSANAILHIWIDGAEARETMFLPRGDTVLAAEQVLDRAGLHTFRVQIDAPGDRVPQNNALDAATVAGPPGRVLLVVSDPASATALATTFARGGLSVQPVLAGTLPSTVKAYRHYDEVVLDNVAATDIRRTQQQALRDAVSTDGLGLLVIGGRNSFGEGGYARSPLEDSLPVLSISTPRRTSAPIALMLVIDKSGSMGDVVAGVTKIDMVKVAAASALDRLATGDSVGVITFDDDTHWLVPFHTLGGAADKANIHRQIAQLGADGDTYIYPALHAAERAVAGVATSYRHVVLLTDGQGEDADFDRLIRQMRREHITLSTIGVGADVVQDELRHWASLGSGRFHYVADPHAIPHIVIGEARYGINGAAEVRGAHIRLGVGAPTPLLRALSGHALPGVTAYDSTAAKITAQVSAQSASGDPLLSSWQYGLGRVSAWTSDAGGSWAPDWNPRRLPEFWTDTARWTMRGYIAGAQAPTLSAQDGTLLVATERRSAGGGFDDAATPRVRLVAPGGAVQVLSLPLVGPGTYSASIPQTEPGVYAATFVRDDRGATGSTDIAALAVPYPQEYAPGGVDTATLTRLADATGGRILTRPGDAFLHVGLPVLITWLSLWPYLLALALLLYPVDVGVRLLLPPGPVYTRRA